MEIGRFWKRLDPVSRYVAQRFALKLVILLALAGAQAPLPYGFRRALFTILGLSGLLSAALGVVLRERLNSLHFTYWDEAAVFLVLCLAVSWTL